jgi:hypothetical protein
MIRMIRSEHPASESAQYASSDLGAGWRGVRATRTGEKTRNSGAKAETAEQHRISTPIGPAMRPRQRPAGSRSRNSRYRRITVPKPAGATAWRRLRPHVGQRPGGITRLRNQQHGTEAATELRQRRQVSHANTSPPQ